ncbi:TonB-dependent receptor [Spongiibacter taiwanensis]|uniref:TonB-dependent receptor family protein n=1 Tax=Spongiibacter taiwanensis TaxID=1748242 RepID=UPI002034A9EA|nr:TonB-dependent receptor [Spongiibacter taiwanensis]USA42365.1 TonB-dependent receptor [Spongiibacter taiwanensis]
MNLLRNPLIFGALLSSTAALAQSDKQPEEVLVTGGKDAILSLGGSAQLIDETMLDQFDFSDLNQVMSTLPGVYIREEDGYGLRPNIGIRGATSERSQKITIMEDGILITPAPYAAPAAYYIPNISRMSAVEVVKGPAAIVHGPHTVGGAINFASRPISEERESEIDLSYGTDNYQKAQFFSSETVGEFGYAIDLLRFSGDGFKELDGGGDTGFERNDINVKLSWKPQGGSEKNHAFTLKLGYADEDADETYLGLTEADFDDDPYRRYRASQLDHFTSEHSQLHLGHSFDLNDSISVSSAVYWHQFDRSWNKLDGFIDGVAIRDVFANPDIFTRELGILRGEINSNGSDADMLDVTNNDRQYGSYGAQTAMKMQFSQGDIDHNLDVGLRIHSDYVERDHSIRGYLMTDGAMINDGQQRGDKELNEASADAIALYVSDTLSWRDFKLTVGLRHEEIDGDADDDLAGTSNSKSQSETLPGVSLYWQYTENLGLLAGVNRGFSPASPSASSGVDPELSTNYEYGLRYQNQNLSLEAIGFFSDYENLLGRCRASDTNCNAGEEFNGGEAEIAGVEVLGQWSHQLSDALTGEVMLSYTYTETAFQSDFSSSFSQWGEVEAGDELPYIPEQIARLQLGAKATRWEAYVAFSYQSEMRDVAGSEPIGQVTHTDAYTTVDASASWFVDQNWTLQLSVDNLLDEEAVVSLRPFGARPNKPRTLRLRVKYAF